jgi:hypothetical protein
MTRSACAFAMLALSTAANAQPAATSQRPDDEAGRSTQFSPALAGTWKSAPDEMALTTDFDVSVWGPNAKSVRTVELQIRPSGEGVLKVTRRVVDARGRTVPASTSVEEARLTIGGSRPTIATRVEHDVKVASAVRTYPDDAGSRWDLAGLKVQIVTFDDDADRNRLEVRFDTAEGRGSFWETLRRDARNPARRASERSRPGASRRRAES